MNILISTFGVRGDVPPYLALAVGLQAAGHFCCLCLAGAQLSSNGAVAPQPDRDRISRPDVRA